MADVSRSVKHRKSGRSPGSDRPDDYEQIDFGLISGGITAADHAHTLLQHEQEELAQELAAKLARKRPMGFTATWDD